MGKLVLTANWSVKIAERIFRLVTSLGWLAMPVVTTRRMVLYVKRSLGWLTMLSVTAKFEMQCRKLL